MTRRDVDAGTAMYARVSEEDFMRQVVEAAKLLGWLYYHPHDSRHSPAGFPDLVLIRNGTLIFAELKSEDGKMTLEQLAWERELIKTQEDSDGIVRHYIWRPHDIDKILRLFDKP